MANQVSDLGPDRTRALKDKIRSRREAAAAISEARNNPLLGSRRAPSAPAAGVPAVDVEGCQDATWANPAPNSKLVELVRMLRNGQGSEQDAAMKLQAALACPIDQPSGTYRDILAFVSAATANANAGTMTVQVDETFAMHRLIVGDELTIGVDITQIKVAGRTQLTNFSNVANAGWSASVFSALNPCPIELDIAAIPSALIIEVDFFNNSGAQLTFKATGYGQAYGC